MTSWSMSPGNFAYVFRSGVRLQVTPEGDCREATFTAKGQGVGLKPLDAVTISVDGTPLFYGEVRVGGNSADVNGHQFTLRSLALRLKEVVLPPNWSAPQQSANLTVRSLIEAVLPQLGGTITIGTINLPFNCRPIQNANQQNPYALLEQIAADGAGMGGDYRFGVNAQKEFFFVPQNTGSMGLSGNLTAGTRWTGPVAEAPCTAVLWYVAKSPAGDWLTYLSQSAFVSAYGMRVKPVSITNTYGLWKLAPYTMQVSDGTTTLNNDAGVMTAMTDGTPRYIGTATPGIHESPGSSVRINAETDNANVYLTQTLTQGAEYLRIDVAWLNGNPSGNKLTITEPGKAPRVFTAYDLKRQITGTPEGSYLVKVSTSSTGKVDANGNVTTTGTGETTLKLAADNSKPPPVDAPAKIEFWGLPPGTVVRLDGTSNPTADAALRRVDMTISELRPEAIDRALLDRLASYHYSVPSETAGEVEATGLTLSRGGNSQWGPVAAIEYRITAARGVCTALIIGQPDDPTKLAQAELIKARDQRAVITAITSTT